MKFTTISFMIYVNVTYDVNIGERNVREAR